MLSSSFQLANFFVGFSRSFSSTCSFQLVPALLSLLSFLSCLLSLAVRCCWVLVAGSSVAEIESGSWVCLVVGIVNERERYWWQGLHWRSPCVIFKLQSGAVTGEIRRCYVLSVFLRIMTSLVSPDVGFGSLWILCLALNRELNPISPTSPLGNSSSSSKALMSTN